MSRPKKPRTTPKWQARIDKMPPLQAVVIAALVQPRPYPRGPPARAIPRSPRPHKDLDRHPHGSGHRIDGSGSPGAAAGFARGKSHRIPRSALVAPMPLVAAADKQIRRLLALQSPGTGRRAAEHGSRGPKERDPLPAHRRIPRPPTPEAGPDCPRYRTRLAVPPDNRG